MKNCYCKYITQTLEEEAEKIFDTPLKEAFSLFSDSICFLSKKRAVSPETFAREMQFLIPSEKNDCSEYMDALNDEYRKANKHGLNDAILDAIDDIQHLFLSTSFYKRNFSSLSPQKREQVREKLTQIMTTFIQITSDKFLNNSNEIERQFSLAHDAASSGFTADFLYGSQREKPVERAEDFGLVQRSISV